MSSLLNDEVGVLLNKAKEEEKKHNWLEAKEFLEKAYKLALNEESCRIAELGERIGFYYYRAAFQAESSQQFRDRIKEAVAAYRRVVEILEKAEKPNEIMIDHAKALIAYAKSSLEFNPQARKKLIEEWWILENKVLKAYEEVGDPLTIGRTLNNLMENSHDRFWLAANKSERMSIMKKCISYGEKSIHALSRTNSNCELARAYCFATWFRSWVSSFQEYQRKELNATCVNYAVKAVEIAQKTGDAWLLGWSYISAWNSAFSCEINPAKAAAFGEKVLEFGTVAKDNYLMGFGTGLTSGSITFRAEMEEDPDKQREGLNEAVKYAQEGIRHFKIISLPSGMLTTYPNLGRALCSLASIETNLGKARSLMKEAIHSIRKGREWIGDWLFGYIKVHFDNYLGSCLYMLSTIEEEVNEKKRILVEAESNLRGASSYAAGDYGIIVPAAQRNIQRFLALTQSQLAKLENRKQIKLDLLKKASTTMEKSLAIGEEEAKVVESEWVRGDLGRQYNIYGEILKQFHLASNEEEPLVKAKEAYLKAAENFEKAELTTHTAESYWQIAKLSTLLGDHVKAAKHYELASEAYGRASKKITPLKQFYKNYSAYMQAWSQIEKARYLHSIEEYDEAKEHYEKSAELHGSTEYWNYLSPNYLAWASMEEAESLSRKENVQEAKEAFQKALKYFTQAENSIKQKIEEITSEEEEQLNCRLFEASDLRRRFCEARIQIEEAKLLDKKGEYLQSSRSYREAGGEIESIIKKIETDAERKELELIMILCRAWEKMALAEGKSSSDVFLEAAELFEEAKLLSLTEKTSLWALANSSFCKGLAAKNQFQSTLERSHHAMANTHMKNAASFYGKAGFEAAADYARAMQRLFDAYVYMNSAEGEVDPEKKTKYYQLTEQLLQIAAGLFVRAKQPEKTKDVHRILVTVKEEKALAASLNRVMQAPTIASSTLSFSAPSPTREISVGLEQFQHANVQANMVAGLTEVKVGESFCLTVEFVNAGKEPALLTRVENFVPADFVVVKKPEIYRLEDTCLNMKGKQIAPLKLVEAKVVLQPSKKGVYQIKPVVLYLDELGQNKSLQLKSLEIKVEEVILADRVSTGTKELDSLLLGGIPEGYAVVLTGSPSDERELIIKNFLEAGTGEGQTSFYATTEAVGLENLLKMPRFYLFLCNPKPKVEVPDLPNVYRLHGKTDLTNLNIALLKAYRSVEQSSQKRVCLDIVSDVLLRHGAETTRRWISELITDMGLKGFTVLAVLDPSMHPTDQANAILNLFDGEISLHQTEDAMECRKSLRVKKLRNQDYIKNPICLTKSAA